MASKTQVPGSPNPRSAKWNNLTIPLCLFLVALVVVAELLVTPDMNASVATSYRDEIIVSNEHAPAYASLRSRSTDKVKLTAAAASSAGKCAQAPAAANAASFPAMYNLQTKLGVSYGPDHWFHIAENFMAVHSALRAEAASHGGGSGSSSASISTPPAELYFNFDEEHFSSALTPMTRFLIAAGVMQPRQQQLEEEAGKLAAAAGGAAVGDTLTLHFLHIPKSLVDPVRLELQQQQLAAANPGAAGQIVQLPTEGNIRDHRVVKLSFGSGSGSDGNSMERFTAREITAAEASAHGGVCVSYQGSIGGKWPTWQRGHWFENSGDSAAFRAEVRDLCPRDPKVLRDLHELRGGRKRKLVIFQRDVSRKFVDMELSLTMLHSRFPQAEWDISVLVHSPDISPCYLAHVLHDADVLLTPHGFQSTALLFLPRPALLFEVFPYRSYKRGYAPLAVDYGLQHAAIMSPPLSWHRKLLLRLVTTEWCMGSKQCRKYARGGDVLLTARGIDALADAVQKQLEPALAGSAASAAGRDSLYK